MGSRGTENTVCISSANRDVHAYPSPSDFMCELKQRFDCQMIVLGSLELPLTQYLVEEDWSRFFFDVGLSYPTQEARTLYVAERPYTQALLTLPAPYTPMIYEGVVEGRAVWRVAPSVQPINAHGLVPRSLEVLGSTRVYHDPTSPALPVESVLSFDAVATSLLPATSTLTPGGGAVLVCTEAGGTRSFANAEQLCSALTAFFSDPFVNLPLRFEYDRSETALAMNVGGPVTVNTSLPNLLQSLYIPTHRGIGALTSARSTRFPGAPERAVPVGNYEYNLLRQQLEILLNPLIQFGSVATSSVGVYVYGAPPGGAVAVSLGGFTLYDPKAVALTLSTQMQTALPAAGIRFDFSDDAFEIFSEVPFRIFWGDSRLGMQLGFDGDLKLAPTHRGSPRAYIQVPTVVTLPPTFEGESTAHLRRLVFATRGRVQAAQTSGVSAEASGGVLLTPIGTVPSEYLVGFPQPAGDYLWAVATGANAGPMPDSSQPLPAWTTRLEPLTPLPLALPPQSGTVVPFFGGACNLYFPAPSVAPRLAEIAGLRRGANLWPTPFPRSRPQSVLVAPAQVCLDIPQLHPHGDRHRAHVG